ncbi:MAG: hypothetical protein [Podoviridae sp. cty5g4]|nr:MAG: hypothetical protein [Podoviridae sp. cty5g4]
MGILRVHIYILIANQNCLVSRDFAGFAGF